MVGVDPLGAIHHIDHLPLASNRAFDEGKALPLIDCGRPHPPPCDQGARGRDNNSRLSQRDVGGAVCGVQWGCRHWWYPGPRGHELRGGLIALLLVSDLG